MEFNSPRPEHVQLNTAVHPKSTSNLLALLHQQIFQATGSHHHSASSDLGSSTHSNRISVSLPKPAELSIETVLEEHLIPSPPLSPKLSHSAAPVKLASRRPCSSIGHDTGETCLARADIFKGNREALPLRYQRIPVAIQVVQLLETQEKTTGQQSFEKNESKQKYDQYVWL